MNLNLLITLALAVFPVQIDIRPGPSETFSATLVGPAAGARGGSFSGRISVNGSSAEIPISGRAEAIGARLRIPLTLRYSDVPQDWANRFRADTFDYRVVGRAGATPVQWTGTARWDDVGVEGERETVQRFVRLVTLEVTDVSLFSSDARAVVAVRNPFSFPLTVASSRYRVSADGRLLGTGSTRGMILRPRQESTVLLPLEVEHGALIAAAGGAVLSGEAVPARLAGALTIRLPRGDVAVPIDLVGRLSVR
ncbi:MAG TPA: LEA type 2 family protein [Thermoanaerobaculia bacterium]|jgi:LEA14-like dessication related protein|nr:LEA type 2 family protein [Thermoanaerobaculia bacterium]